MKRSTPVLTLFLLSLCLGGCGISGNLRGNPGYADFDSPGLFDTDRVVAVSLGPLPLKLARIVIDEDEDPEASALLKDLDAVRVYVYEIDRRGDRVAARMDDTVSELTARGWEPVATVREDGGTARVMLRTDRRQRIRGMVVMAQEPRELVLINLIGKIRPDRFNVYMAGLEIDAPELRLASN